MSNDGYIEIDKLNDYTKTAKATSKSNDRKIRTKQRLSKLYSGAKKYGSKFKSAAKTVGREAYKFGEYTGNVASKRPDMKKNAGYQILQGFMGEQSVLKQKGKRAKKRNKKVNNNPFGGYNSW